MKRTIATLAALLWANLYLSAPHHAASLTEYHSEFKDTQSESTLEQLEKQPEKALTLYFVPSFGGTGYDWGNCTFGAAIIRAKMGNPVPTNLGNAAQWAVNARSYYIPTGYEPTVGAVAVDEGSYYGHVAVVRAINSDGSILVTEENVYGLGVVDDRTVPAGVFDVYIY